MQEVIVGYTVIKAMVDSEVAKKKTRLLETVKLHDDLMPKIAEYVANLNLQDKAEMRYECVTHYSSPAIKITVHNKTNIFSFNVYLDSTLFLVGYRLQTIQTGMIGGQQATDSEQAKELITQRINEYTTGW